MWIWVSSNAVLPLCLYYWIRGPDNQLLNLLCHIMEGRGVKLHMVVQRPGNWATVLHVDVRVPPVPALDGRGQMIALVCTGESVMAAKSRQESLVSPPLTAPVPGATKPALRTPRYSRPDWLLWPTSAGFFGLVPLDSATARGYAMMASIVRDPILFYPDRGNLYLSIEWTDGV